jgi:hypothetical protein
MLKMKNLAEMMKLFAFLKTKLFYQETSTSAINNNTKDTRVPAVTPISHIPSLPRLLSRVSAACVWSPNRRGHFHCCARFV